MKMNRAGLSRLRLPPAVLPLASLFKGQRAMCDQAHQQREQAVDAQRERPGGGICRLPF